MRHAVSVKEQEKTSSTTAESKKPRPGLIRRLFKFCAWLVLILIIAGVVIRPFLPKAILWYVNRTLNQSPVYQGKVGGIQLALWRGAYTIKDVRIIKTTGNIPVPLFSAPEVDLSVEWRAILHRKIVATILVTSPQVNFVDDPSAGDSETGAGGPWLKIIRGLFPFDINSARVNNGSVHFRTYQKQTPVDVYLSHMNAEVDDLTNVNRSSTPLLASVNVSALAMDQAKLEMHMKFNPFSYKPTLHLDLRLLGLDITATNPLVEVYGGFNVKQGSFDLVLDVDSQEGQLTGYIKPLFRNMVVFDLVTDVKEDNPIQLFWQAIVGGVSGIITNYNRDQLATLIPFTGNLEGGPQVDYLATIGNMLRNAFIRAYLPRLEKELQQSDNSIDFGPTSIVDPISVGNTP